MLNGSTTLPQHLNNRADRLANEHRTLSAGGRTKATRLPHQPVLVTFGGTSYHSDVVEAAKQHFVGDTAETYIMEKFCIPRATMSDIDWETIRRVTKSIPLNQRATKSKFTF